MGIMDVVLSPFRLVAGVLQGGFDGVGSALGGAIRTGIKVGLGAMTLGFVGKIFEPTLNDWFGKSEIWGSISPYLAAPDGIVAYATQTFGVAGLAGAGIGAVTGAGGYLFDSAKALDTQQGEAPSALSIGNLVGSTVGLAAAGAIGVIAYESVTGKKIGELFAEGPKDGTKDLAGLVPGDLGTPKLEHADVKAVQPVAVASAETKVGAVVVK